MPDKQLILEIKNSYNFKTKNKTKTLTIQLKSEYIEMDIFSKEDTQTPFTAARMGLRALY